jgi:redox-sensitive bicupin YhaK (pirin superfamily)
VALIHDKSVRGRTQTGWLDSRHTFSFGGFLDPGRMGHRALRVLNDDVVIPGAGFGEHGHQEMDIVTYVLSGALRHGDSMGNSSVIHAGEFQHIYAGTGVRDSEMNASDTESVHLLQIWIIPERAGGAPTYF